MAVNRPRTEASCRPPANCVPRLPPRRERVRESAAGTLGTTYHAWGWWDGVLFFFYGVVAVTAVTSFSSYHLPPRGDPPPADPDVAIPHPVGHPPTRPSPAAAARCAAMPARTAAARARAAARAARRRRGHTARRER